MQVWDQSASNRQGLRSPTTWQPTSPRIISAKRKVGVSAKINTMVLIRPSHRWLELIHGAVNVMEEVISDGDEPSPQSKKGKQKKKADKRKRTSWCLLLFVGTVYWSLVILGLDRDMKLNNGIDWLRSIHQLGNSKSPKCAAWWCSIIYALHRVPEFVTVFWASL